MKIYLIMVTSADGFIARSETDNPLNWNSPEDRTHFRKLTKEIGTMLMGGTTFATSGTDSFPGRKVYVLTNHADNYRFGKGVEAVAGTAPEVVAKLREQDIESLALTGGADVNRQFLLKGLVDELYLTIEPVLFGSGIKLSGDLDDMIIMKLLSRRQLNPQGTLLLHYRILYS